MTIRIIIRALAALVLLQTPAGAKMPPSNALPQKPPQIAPSTYDAQGRWAAPGLPQALYAIDVPVVGHTPEDKARQFLAGATLALPSVLELRHHATRSTAAGDNVHFHQYLGGLPVYNGRVLVHVSPNSRVTHAASSPLRVLLPNPGLISLSAAQAEQRAISSLGAQAPFRLRRSEQMLYPAGDSLHTVWRVELIAATPQGDWEFLIDAHTGEELVRWDRAAYATGSVFDPDPLSSSQTAYGQPISDNGDNDYPEIAAEVFVEDFGELNQLGSLYALSSPWAELVDSEAPALGFFYQNSPDFLFSRDQDGFEASNVFWHIQISMQYINETLGIPLMPYQYEGGVRFDPHGVNGDDNSHYSSGSGEVAFGEGCVDDAEDADVIWHELGHGVHDWITAGGLSNMIDGLSEGFGDYWAHSYSRSKQHWQPDTDEYHWVFNWDGHNECWAGRVTNYALPWPVGITPFPAIHTGGQIFSTCMMAVYDQLGREKTDTIVLEGLAMTTLISSQNDAANAIYQAAADLEYSTDELSALSGQLSSCGYIMYAPLGIDLPPPLNPGVDSPQADKQPQVLAEVVNTPTAGSAGAWGWMSLLVLLLGRRRLSAWFRRRRAARHPDLRGGGSRDRPPRRVQHPDARESRAPAFPADPA